MMKVNFPIKVETVWHQYMWRLRRYMGTLLPVSTMTQDSEMVIWRGKYKMEDMISLDRVCKD